MNNTLDQAHRELAKWLNEGQIKPIDRVALATVLAAVAPEREPERNFCPRCGERSGGPDHIHTCTPPEPKTNILKEHSSDQHKLHQ